MACNSKIAERREKVSEIWDSWILVTHIWGTFDLVGFKVIFGVIRCTCLKMALSQKRLAVEKHRVKCGDCNTYRGYIWPSRVQGYFRVIRCTCLKMAYISKTAGRRAKRSEIWDSGARVAHLWGIFDLVMFKVICGSFRALVSEWPVTRKRLVVHWNGVKCLDSGTVVTHITYIYGTPQLHR